MSHSSDLSQSAKAQINALGTQAKEAATREAAAQADRAKSLTAAKAQQAAQVAEAVAREMDPASPQAQAVHQLADRIEEAATKLRQSDVRELAGQASDLASDMARRNPALFIGGAAVAGFVAARFLKARDPARPLDQPDSPATHGARNTQMTAWTINDDPDAQAPRNDRPDGTVLSQMNGSRTNG